MNLSYITYHPADDSGAASFVVRQLEGLGVTGITERPCASMREFLGLFAQEVADHDLILLGVGSREFQRVKTTVAKAIGLPLVQNGQVLARVSVLEGMEEAYCQAQAALPEGSVPLITEDGLGSGFYAQSGTQHLMLFPLDEERTPALCAQTLIPLLSSLLFPEGVPVPLTLQEKAEVRRAALGLKDRGLLLSIADTSISSAVQDIMQQVPELSDVLVPPAKNDSKCPAEEVMIKAKDVRREQQTAFGGAVSSVFQAEEGIKQIHVALAVPGRALRSQLSAPAGAERNLKKTAVICLCSMVNHQLSQLQAAKASSAVPVAKEKKVQPTSKSKTPWIFAALAVLAVVFCVVLAFVLKGRGAKPQKTAAGAIPVVQMQADGNTVCINKKQPRVSFDLSAV